MKVVCISGKAQHGKDTTAGMMKTALESMGHTVLIAHYGDLVKYVCRTFFGWNGEKDAYGRSLLQKVGTDIVREQRPNYWVDFVKDMLSMFPNEWDFVLIPDSRFPFDRPHNRSYNDEAAGMVRVETWDEIYEVVSEFADMLSDGDEIDQVLKGVDVESA